MGETYMEGLKLLKVLIYVGNDRKLLLKDPTKGPTIRTKDGRDTTLIVSIAGPNDGSLVDQQPIVRVS